MVCPTVLCSLALPPGTHTSSQLTDSSIARGNPSHLASARPLGLSPLAPVAFPNSSAIADEDTAVLSASELSVRHFPLPCQERVVVTAGCFYVVIDYSLRRGACTHCLHPQMAKPPPASPRPKKLIPPHLNDGAPCSPCGAPPSTRSIFPAAIVAMGRGRGRGDQNRGKGGRGSYSTGAARSNGGIFGGGGEMLVKQQNLHIIIVAVTSTGFSFAGLRALV